MLDADWNFWFFTLKNIRYENKFFFSDGYRADVLHLLL